MQCKIMLLSVEPSHQGRALGCAGSLSEQAGLATGAQSRLAARTRVLFAQLPNKNLPANLHPNRRYFRTAANSTAASLIDNNYDRARCTRSVVHAGWTPSTARNDIALCFFNGASRFTPVRLAQGE
jgi:hypothetical protein